LGLDSDPTYKAHFIADENLANIFVFGRNSKDIHLYSHVQNILYLSMEISINFICIIIIILKIEIDYIPGLNITTENGKRYTK